MKLQCYYCHSVKAGSIDELVHYSESCNLTYKFFVLQPFDDGTRSKYRAHHYNVTSASFIENLKSFHSSIKESPISKGAKLSTPHKTVTEYSLIDAEVQTVNVNIIDADIKAEEPLNDSQYYNNLATLHKNACKWQIPC